ncbi:polysaccharide biosynthesis protein [Geotalea toluenoxydans]
MFSARRILVFLLDVCLILAAFVISFLLRFDFQIPASERDIILNGLCVIMIVKPLVFVASGMYRNIWRYASLQDAIQIFKVVTFSTVISAFVLMLIKNASGLPRSVYVLDWFVLFSLVAASRLVWRVYREVHIMPKIKNGHRTLIIGAGEAGSLLSKEIWKQENSPYQVIGFIDDDAGKQGLKLNGVPVLGRIERLRALVRKHQIEEVIFAIPSASRDTMRTVIGCCEKSCIKFKTLPSITDIVDGNISVHQIKDVEIEDLLGRESVVLDQAAIRGYLTDKRVIVTGAAGSIGSEICRQVAKFKPSKILLFDNAETPLYYIEKELTETFPELRVVPVIGDVKNVERVESIFDEFEPEVVFHAAAYKHVPMMEYNPVEAVNNNIRGTKVLADAARKHSVKNFVMISTDKAVNPTNIMGASKRAAEIYVQALAVKSKTKFTTVRFGNVLGSNGSVIPLFKEQIKKGGPVTVTDREVIRYFMTIPEASQLVLQAGCIGNGGDIFVLDMGEPVRILDLAEELIKLSGLVPYQDIDIVFTGLRPGEKLFEELLIEGEGVKPTKHKKIRVLSAVESDMNIITQEMETLFKAAEHGDLTTLMFSLKQLVPEFTPRYVFDGPAPAVFQRLRHDLFVTQQSAINEN